MKKELTKRQKQVLSVLKYGGENLTTTKTITNLTGISPRDIRQIISDLREEYPICSTTYNGGGYFIANTNKEIGRFIKGIQNRINEHEVTITNMIRHVNKLR